MNRHKLAFSLIGIFIVQLSYAGYFKHIGREEGLSQSSVMAIYQDKLGRMWFGTREGVNIYNSTDANQRPAARSKPHVRDLASRAEALTGKLLSVGPREGKQDVGDPCQGGRIP